MTDLLAFTLTAVSLVSGLVVLAMAVANRYRWRSTAPVLLVIELAVLTLAALDLTALCRGHTPAEPVTHLAYLVTGILLLPLAASQAVREPGRWGGVLVAVALFILAVLVIRQTTTGRSA